MSDNDSVSSVGMDFSGDAVPTAMDPYLDDVISARQQSVLNELREDLCYDDLNYLNEHKEVEAIATLVLKEVSKNAPKNPSEHAARYLSHPQMLNSIAQFVKSQSSINLDLVDRDAKTYATTTAMMTDTHTDNGSGLSEEQDDEQNYEQNEELDDTRDDEQDENQDEEQDKK